MSLDAALSIAQSGLSYVQKALAQTSQNVANAGTTGYTRKQVTSIALTTGQLAAGVKTGAATRDVDYALQAQLNTEAGAVAATTAREQLLTGVEAAHGTTDGNDSLGSLTAALQDSFTVLEASPSDQSLQNAVVQSAQSLADRIHTVSGAIGDARQQAQDGIVSEVASVNTGLNQIASLTKQIVAVQASGGSTADLEDQRDQAISTLSASIPVRTLRADNGSITLLTANGLNLPLQETGDAFTTEDAQVGPDAYYGTGGSLPGIKLAGVDVTNSLSGGRLGEYVDLRDDVLPRQQAEIDVAASTIAYRFQQAGLTLFTGSTETVSGVPAATATYPSGGQAGYADLIAVNPAVAANPSLVRDGNKTIGSFTPNPSDGPASYTALIDRVINGTFGSKDPDGNAWPSVATSYTIGGTTLTSSFRASSTLDDYTAQVTASQTGERSAATDAKTSATAQQQALQTRFNDRSGVDSDTEMATLVQLQNAYAANAKVMTTVQSMWDALLAAVS